MRKKQPGAFAAIASCARSQKFFAAVNLSRSGALANIRAGRVRVSGAFGCAKLQKRKERMGQGYSPQTALIVEPSDELRELVGILLEETGYEVIETPSLDDVVDLMEDGLRVSLLFVDLPARDLVGLARKISHDWPWVRLIVPCAGQEEAEALPDTALRMNSPWNALDVLIQAERARLSTLH
jgi:CheY-like chemotaxis protein